MHKASKPPVEVTSKIWRDFVFPNNAGEKLGDLAVYWAINLPWDMPYTTFLKWAVTRFRGN